MSEPLSKAERAELPDLVAELFREAAKPIMVLSAIVAMRHAFYRCEATCQALEAERDELRAQLGKSVAKAVNDTVAGFEMFEAKEVEVERLRAAIGTAIDGLKAGIAADDKTGAPSSATEWTAEAVIDLLLSALTPQQEPE